MTKTSVESRPILSIRDWKGKVIQIAKEGEIDKHLFLERINMFMSIEEWELSVYEKLFQLEKELYYSKKVNSALIYAIFLNI